MEKSSIALVSNIMLKSKFEKDKNEYLPYDLLPKVYHDKRMMDSLSAHQKLQSEKQLFHADKIIDVDG